MTALDAPAVIRSDREVALELRRGRWGLGTIKACEQWARTGEQVDGYRHAIAELARDAQVIAAYREVIEGPRG